MKMNVLVTFAVKAEFAPWGSRHPFVPYEFENWERPRPFDLLKANIGASEVSVLLTGIGGENAQAAMRSIPIEAYHACISTGLAGALDISVQLGDVAVARTSLTADGKLHFESDGILAELAVACGARQAGISITADHIVGTAEEKEKLSSSGNVVEMETTYVLAAAAEKHVPAIAIRAISDAADEDLPVDFTRILDSHGQLKFGGLLKEVGLHPYRIGPLTKFAMQSRAAAKALADFLDRFIPVVAQHQGRARPINFQGVSAR